MPKPKVKAEMANHGRKCVRGTVTPVTAFNPDIG